MTDQDVKEIKELLYLLCDKLGVRATPDRSIKQLDEIARGTIIKLQSRKKRVE